jgi:hypothetical protein
MNKDSVLGAVILVVSIVVIAVYVWLVFFPPIAGADLLLLEKEIGVSEEKTAGE